MKNRYANRAMSAEELYALKRAARAARAVEMGRFIRRVVTSVTSFTSTLRAKEIRHA